MPHFTAGMHIMYMRPLLWPRAEDSFQAGQRWPAGPGGERAGGSRCAVKNHRTGWRNRFARGSRNNLCATLDKGLRQQLVSGATTQGKESP